MSILDRLDDIQAEISRRNDDIWRMINAAAHQKGIELPQFSRGINITAHPYVDVKWTKVDGSDAESRIEVKMVNFHVEEKQDDYDDWGGDTYSLAMTAELYEGGSDLQIYKLALDDCDILAKRDRLQKQRSYHEVFDLDPKTVTKIYKHLRDNKINALDLSWNEREQILKNLGIVVDD